MEAIALQNIPSREFPRQVSFDSRLPRQEFVRRGLCQLLIASFKELYELNQKYLNLPELSEELEIIEYSDKSFALSWWSHQLYRLEFEEILDHEGFALIKNKKAHESYAKKELRQKKDLEQKLKELLEKANGSLISAE